MDAPASRRPPGPDGSLVVVVGPSGAGKDTLINAARTRLGQHPRLRFARRVITREPGGGEPHDTLDRAAFAEAAATGAFSLWWEANGLLYGVPRVIESWLASGCTVIVNGSRDRVPAFRARFPGCLVVHVTARPETLARRLAERGRESAQEQTARAARARSLADGLDADVVIANDGAPEEAIAAFLGWLTARIDNGAAA
jgi:ribose 1,5-bisphosphokinase